MATAYTSLLGLALPVTGELSGTWGDIVNDTITSLLDTAVAGTTSLTTDADVTLTTTDGVANEARQAIILWNPASGTTTRNITAPAQSKIYTVINASGGTQSIVFRGAGPTTGVTIIKGESAVVAWNGSDFIKISNTGGGGSFTNVTISGTTTLSGLTASTALALNASKEVVSVTNTGTGNNVLSASPTLTGTISGANASLSGTLAVTGVATLTAQPILSSLTASQAVFTDGSKGLVSNAITGTGNVVMSASPTLTGTLSGANASLSGTLAVTGVATLGNGAVLGTPASVTLTNATGLPISTGVSGLGTGIATALAVNVGSAGAPVLFNGALGTPSSGTVTNLTGTASININGTVGATTANTGAFTTLTTSSTVTVNGGTANGVAYLDGSKVLTTGSALTFDGAILGVNGVSVGRGAGAVSTNTAVGASALAATASGFRNTGLGYVALTALTSGAENTGLGAYALTGNTTGGYNVALGSQTLIGNITGSNNTAVGWNSLASNTTASNNTAVGYQAGYSNTTGATNSYFGFQAGYGITTGGVNTFLGYNAGASITTGAKNTIIGAYGGNQGGLDIRTADSHVVLSDGDGNPRGIFDGSGQFLVGATSFLSNSGVGFKVLTPSASHWDPLVVTSSNSSSLSCWDIYSTATSSYRFYVTTAGVVNAVSTTITAISDQRLKENIRDLDDGLDIVMALKPRKFDWKEGKGADTKNARGFIAQEFQMVLPDLIDEWKDPAPEGEEPYKAVRADLIPVLVKAIQELKAEFDAYKAAHP